MSLIIKKSHKEWRKEVKKLRRKKIRQKLAKQRDDRIADENAKNLKNPTYLTWLAEQRCLELFRDEEEQLARKRVHEEWLASERKIVDSWNAKQLKLRQAEEAKELSRLRIQQEFETEQNRLREVAREKKRIEEATRLRNEQLTEKIENYINGFESLPAGLFESTDSNPGKPNCPFYTKTATCRFGNRCSRNHCRPGLSNLLVIPNLFTHIQLDQHKNTEYGNDLAIEYEDQELYAEFREFFDDVVPEFEKFGKLTQFRVCYNHDAHLRGHTFVEFKEKRGALKACRRMQGRYYGGRMMNIEFGSIYSWKQAICGLSFANKCPKGRYCNFLHVFKNPRNRFAIVNRKSPVPNAKPQLLERNNLSWNDDEKDVAKNRHWRWSESPEKSSRSRDASSSKEKLCSTLRYDRQSSSSLTQDNLRKRRSRSPSESKKRKRRSRSRHKDTSRSSSIKHKKHRSRSPRDSLSRDSKSSNNSKNYKDRRK